MVYQYLTKMGKKLTMTNKIKNCCYIIAGIYFITAPLLFKLLNMNKIKDIKTYNYILISFLCFIIFCTIIKIVFDLFIEKKNNNIFLRFKEIILTFYIDSMKTIDDYIKHKLLGPQYVGEFLGKWSTILLKYSDNKSSMFFTNIICLFDLLPRLLLLFILYVEVFIFKKVHYSYIFGTIVLLKPLFSYLLFTFREFSEHNIKNICTTKLIFFDKNSIAFIPENEINENIKKLPNEKIKLSFNVSCHEKTLNHIELVNKCHFYLENLEFFIMIRRIIYILDLIKQTMIYVFFNILVLILYLILWSYILYVILC
jgi:hypothetical protein